jgi:hypothetical protein
VAGAPKPVEAGTPDPVVMNALKKRYFDVISHENYPHTPDLTSEADRLEVVIKSYKIGGAS